jgi:hypothetical protein
MPVSAQVRLHVPPQRVRSVLACELIHAVKVGEDFAVDPLPEGALVAAAALHAGAHLGGQAAATSGFLHAFLRGRRAARNARTMRSSVAWSGTPNRFRICVALRVIARRQDSGGEGISSPSLFSASQVFVEAA